jgi:hypothetical protein
VNKNRCDGYLTVMVGCARTRGERNNRGGQNASIAYGKPNSDTNLLVRQPHRQQQDIKSFGWWQVRSRINGFILTFGHAKLD